eukprot:gene27490-62381_t
MADADAAAVMAMVMALSAAFDALPNYNKDGVVVVAVETEGPWRDPEEPEPVTPFTSFAAG